MPSAKNPDNQSEKNNGENNSSASYRLNKENFGNDINSKIKSINRNMLNSESEIVKNYGSFNSLNDINKLTNQMAFNKANLNTNENFFESKKSNKYSKSILSKISSKKKDVKRHSPNNKIDLSNTSSLSSLDSNLNYYEKANNNIKSGFGSIHPKIKNTSNKEVKENEFEGKFQCSKFLNNQFYL